MSLISLISLRNILWGIWTYLKSDNNILTKLILALWVYIAGIHSYIYLTSTLILIDTLIGGYSAHKRGELSFKKLLFGVWTKIVNYSILLSSVFLIEQILKTVWSYSVYYMVFFCCFSIGLYELSSILKGLFKLNPHLLFIKRYIDLSTKFSNIIFDKAEKKIEQGVDEFMGLKDDFTPPPSEEGSI